MDAVQWLSHPPPVGTKDGIRYYDGGGLPLSGACAARAAPLHGSSTPHHASMLPRSGPAVTDAFRKQSEADLDGFLRLRAREFALNGLLLVIVPGTLGDSCVGDGLFTCVWDAAAELAGRERIDASLLEDLIMPVYFMTEDVGVPSCLVTNSCLVACGMPSSQLCSFEQPHAPRVLQLCLHCTTHAGSGVESLMRNCAEQEMEAAAHRSGCWEVLQRGIAMLTQAGPPSPLLVQPLDTRERQPSHVPWSMHSMLAQVAAPCWGEALCWPCSCGMHTRLVRTRLPLPTPVIW